MHKTQVVPKTLRMRFDKMNGFMMVLDAKIKHLVLFGYELADKIFREIKCLKSKKKNGITKSINYNFRKIKID